MKIKKVFVGITYIYVCYKWVAIPVYEYSIVWFWQ